MSRNLRNNDTTRPRKSGAAKRRRELVHRRRLLALGMPEKIIGRLSAQQIRALLHRPAEIPNFLKQIKPRAAKS